MNIRSFFQILPPRIPCATLASTPEPLPLPERVTLLWPDRAPADLAVRAGDSVKTGQNLARADKDFLVSTVTGGIEEISVFDGPQGCPYAAVAIQVAPKDDFDPSLKAVQDVESASPVSLRNALFEAGFSSLSSLCDNPALWPNVDTLVVSALDADPLGIADQQALRDNPEGIENGIAILQKATEASRIVMAVPEGLADSAGRLPQGAARMVRMPALYPNGLPEILAAKCAGGVLLERKGADITGDTLVIGAEEAAATTCILDGKPLMERTVSISSGNAPEPVNVRVRIGAPVSDILAHLDIQLQPKGKLILNGIFRGYACFSDEQPVAADTGSIHVQAPADVFFYQQTACTNCGKCNAICPVDLEVNLLGRYSEYGVFDKCRSLGAENCIECGLCAYVCPARRPLVQFISHAKHAIRTQTMSQISMEEALACNACGPTCPALRLFETGPPEGAVPDKNQE
ncbi:MAG: 4Fe-4S dicluster domain-containing protein [Deltaproteobacteria bacterium]|nr:4Fe-4S dicluster domain-containing protein [Deltaproteobacteria bacterium]